ncbi:Transcriptional regulator, LysR family [uncultured Pleomorphomonas sp.]|uniref:Transcriptional regulator, LysR family n=2 Tax=uncultured Pleomorphomonas sp. TaxID=442121 RepID=A0A212LEU7_9HYPH|nr:Transcriptional regulator, LysR family [uncultured Pleomorphomonas sp.]
MSQPAVSYQINRLEECLGTALFARRSRGVDLLDDGEALLEAVQAAIGAIDEAVDGIRRGRRPRTLSVATDYALAAFRLMPTVAAFRDRHPDVDLRIAASSLLPPAGETGPDLGIQFGRREDFPEDATLFEAEEVLPVCSPGWLDRHGPIAHPADLAEADLLHLETSQDHRWFTWESWLRAAGADLPPGRRGGIVLNTYTMVIEAAMAGQGVALGWRGLIDRSLASGELVPATPVSLRSDKGYFLTFRRGLDAGTLALARDLTAMM